MSTTLSFQRRKILQISLILAVVLLTISLASAIHLGLLVTTKQITEEIKSNPQQQNLMQAVEIINEQTL